MSNMYVMNSNLSKNVTIIENLSAIGIAERVAHEYRGKLYQDKDTKDYLLWNGMHFDLVTRNTLKPLFRNVIEKIPFTDSSSGVYKTKDGDFISGKQIKNFAQNACGPSAITKAISMLDTCSGVTVDASEFDTDTLRVNVQNGILDLKTGKLVPHDPAFRSIRIANANYNPAASCPTFMKFLKDISNNNDELSDYLQVLSGYFFTGLTREQQIYIFHGLGSNGKSTFLNLLLKIAGGYGIQTPASTLLKKSSSVIRCDLPRLKAKWLVVASETNPDAKFDEAAIKTMTGGEEIVARLLFKNYESFQPQFKIALSVNVLPQIEGNDYGIERRIRVIPFLKKFSGENLDMNLSKELEKEMEGIFAWIVEGAQKYLKSGMPKCNLVENATKHYMQEMNILAEFLGDCCNIDINNKKYKTNLPHLYDIYVAWAKRNRPDILNRKRITTMMLNGGYKQRKSGSQRYWEGIRIKFKGVGQ